MARRTIDELLAQARAEIGTGPRRPRRMPPRKTARRSGGHPAADVLARDGPIAGAIHQPAHVLEWRADPDCEWRDDRIADLDAPLVLFCSQGYASSLAAQTLREMGFTRVTDMDGGLDAWKAAGLPGSRELSHVDPAGLRRQYDGPPFDVADLAPTWLEQFQRWLDDAVAATVPEPNAMVVATADADGAPSARTVLLRGVDERGLTFYTNLESRKGREALANPRAAACSPGSGCSARSIVARRRRARRRRGGRRLLGHRDPSPRGISAAASPQSQVVASREALEAAWAQVAEQGDDLPRPAHWSGLRIVPGAVEFWQGAPRPLPRPPAVPPAGRGLARRAPRA